MDVVLTLGFAGNGPLRFLLLPPLLFLYLRSLLFCLLLMRPSIIPHLVITRGGLPVGAQLVSAPVDDAIILALASALESATEDLRP